MLTHEQPLLLIGQVQALSGIPIRTIRYYESLGLLKSSGRTEGGFRQFPEAVLTRLSFIKRLQSLGLSLEEIGNVLKVYDQGHPPCGEIKVKLEDKLVQIDHQIEQLLTLKSEIGVLLSGWKNMDSKREDKICTIIQP
jgi:MerR family transcriptional regulator, copper efflux regulator